MGDRPVEGPEPTRHARRIAAWRQRGAALVARVSAWLSALRRTIPALDLVWEVGTRFRRRNGSVLVGHLAYRLFVWLAPLMLVSVGALGIASSEAVDLVQYSTEFGVSAETATDVARQAESSRVSALVIGVPALAFATVGLIRGAHYAYAQAWGLEIRRRKRILKQTFITIGFAIALLAIYFAIGAVQRHGPLLALGGWAGMSAVTVVALWGVSWVLPRGTDRLFELLPGPIVAALGLSLVQLAMAVYLPERVESASALYGALGVAIAVLVYMFLIANLLVLTPLVNSVWADRAEILDGRPWVMDPEVLPGWAQRPARWVLRATAPTSSERDGGETAPREPGNDAD